MSRMLRASILAATVALAACGESFDPANDARIRFIHAAADAPQVDFYIAQEREISGAAFKGASSYTTVTAGSPALQVTRSGQSTALASLSSQLQAGRDYTVIATGPLANVALRAFQDDNAAPANGQAKLRFIHVAPAAAGLDVYVTAPGADLANAQPTVANIARDAASVYFSRAAGAAQVRFTTAGTKTVVLDAGTLNLAAGQIRTIVALDRNGGGSPLQAGILQDRN